MLTHVALLHFNHNRAQGIHAAFCPWTSGKRSDGYFIKLKHIPTNSPLRYHSKEMNMLVHKKERNQTQQNIFCESIYI